MQKIKFNKILQILFIIFCSYTSQAQIHLKGIIKSENTKEILPYVNIGIINKAKGTVSNDRGNFYLLLQKPQYKDSIRISMIGYHSKAYLVKNFIKQIKEDNTVYLTENIETLEEVVITKRRIKYKNFGNGASSRKTLIEFDSDNLGNEIGIKIKIRRSPTLIKTFNATVLSRKYKSFKFRLNIYNLKDGLPNKNLLNETIIITEKDIDKRKLSINLEKYNLYMTDDFVISLEWIENKIDKKLQLSASLFGNRTFVRETSQSKWEKLEVGSIGFNVNVKY